MISISETDLPRKIGPFEAGIWEQSFGFAPWSKHRSLSAAIRAAVRYARGRTSPTGGRLTWAGGVRPGGDGNRVIWVDREGMPL